MTCGTCRFWDGDRYSDGECHRHAPSSDPQGERMYIWPRTYSNQWCGEYEAKPVNYAQQLMDEADRRKRNADPA